MPTITEHPNIENEAILCHFGSESGLFMANRDLLIKNLNTFPQSLNDAQQLPLYI